MTQVQITGKDLYNAGQNITGYRNATSSTPLIDSWMAMTPDELRADLREQYKKLELDIVQNKKDKIKQIISIHTTRLEWADRWDDVYDSNTVDRNSIKGSWEYDIILSNNNGRITATLEGFDVSNTDDTEQGAISGLKEIVENSHSVGMESLSLHTPE